MWGWYLSSANTQGTNACGLSHAGRKMTGGCPLAGLLWSWGPPVIPAVDDLAEGVVVWEGPFASEASYSCTQGWQCDLGSPAIFSINEDIRPGGL
jgi:hypothetical protein